MDEIVIIVETLDYEPIPLSPDLVSIRVVGTQGEAVTLIVDVDQLARLNGHIAAEWSGRPSPSD